MYFIFVNFGRSFAVGYESMFNYSEFECLGIFIFFFATSINIKSSLGYPEILLLK